MYKPKGPDIFEVGIEPILAQYRVGNSVRFSPRFLSEVATPVASTQKRRDRTSILAKAQFDNGAVLVVEAARI